MNVGRYLRGEDRHVGTARIYQVKSKEGTWGSSITKDKIVRQLAEDGHEVRRLFTLEEVKAAFTEGFFAPETYNDTYYNTVEEAWAKVEKDYA